MYLDTKVIGEILSTIFATITVLLLFFSFLSIWLIGLRQILYKGEKQK